MPPGILFFKELKALMRMIISGDKDDRKNILCKPYPFNQGCG
jgi:hypothetical protein